jgi:hypothetical protein
MFKYSENFGPKSSDLTGDGPINYNERSISGFIHLSGRWGGVLGVITKRGAGKQTYSVLIGGSGNGSFSCLTRPETAP